MMGVKNMNSKSIRIILLCAIQVFGLRLLCGSACAAQANGAAPAEGPPTSPPNVIVILFDDTGWSDFGCYGSEIRTPNIDSLASRGVRFRNFYQTARCSPTRISLMSGLYPQQGAVDPGASLPNLRTDNNVIMAEVLGSAGYRTYMTGKWHLGRKQYNRDPISRGFMHVFAQGVDVDLAGTSDPFGYWLEDKYYIVSENDEIPRRQYASQGLQFHYSDAIGDYCVDFIDHHVSKNDGKPFFLYIPFNAPHWPVNAPAEIANHYTDVGDAHPEDTDVCLYEQGWDVIRDQKYQRQLAMGVVDSRFVLSPKGDHPVPPTAIPDWNTLDANRKMDLVRRQAVYAAMIEQNDMNIGKVIQKLTEEGLLDNTLFFLCCDNGANYEGGLYGNTINPWNPDHLDSMGQPENSENTSYPRVNQGGGWANMSNTPFRLFKHFTHEGGIRTAAILSWPAGTDPAAQGSWTEESAHLIDVMATVVAATGAQYPTAFNGHDVLPMEGVSLLPVLGGQPLPARDIGVEHETNRAFFRGDYKLVTKNFSFTDGSSVANELELYNLQDDPTELNNLVQQEPGVLAEMVHGWNVWAERVGVPAGRLLPNVLPDPDYPEAFFQDTYTRPDNYDIDAQSQGMSGSLSPLTYVESFEGAGSHSIQVVSNHLQMATGNGMGSMYLDHNFIDSSILTNGGFTMMLDILEILGGDNPQDRFGGFGIGLTAAEAASANDSMSGVALRGMADGSGATALSDFYIDLAMDGVLRAWAGNTLLSASDVGIAAGRIRVDFFVPSFNAGASVTACIYFNGQQKDQVSFAWDHANQNYIGFSARATTYVKMDNLVIMPCQNREVAHWTLDQSDVMDGQYIDVSGQGHDAVPDITPDPGQFVAGVDPTETNEGLDLTVEPLGAARTGAWAPTFGTGEVTVSGWVKWDGPSQSWPWQGLVCSRSAGVDPQGDVRNFLLEIQPSGILQANAAGTVLTATTLPIGQWAHVVLSASVDEYVIYMDGVPVATQAPAAAVGEEIVPLYLGAIDRDTQGFRSVFNGVIDDVRIYSHAKDKFEIADMYYAITETGVCLNPDGHDMRYDVAGGGPGGDQPDCVIDMADLAAFAARWLDCGYYPQTACY